MRQCLNEDFGVEFSDVCRFSTQTDKFYPYMELVFYGDAVDRGLAKTEYLGDYRKI